MRRTDVHRAGALVPTDYEFVEAYHAYETDWRLMQANREHLEWLRVHVIAKHKVADHGGFGKCTACGASFKYGTLWLHADTDTIIHLGHECASKYGALAAHPAAERAAMDLKKKTARALEKAIAATERAEFLAKHEGLEADLALNHPILRDMAEKLKTYRKLSDKQVAFARKLANEVRNPKPPRAEDVKVAAPIADGRQVVEGTVISVKEVASDFGIVTKMTVKVQTESGVWLAWGTAPRSLFDWTRQLPFQHAWDGVARGDVVRFTAKLRPGNEPHFAVFSRPTQAEHLAMDVTRRLTNRRAGVR